MARVARAAQPLGPIKNSGKKFSSQLRTHAHIEFACDHPPPAVEIKRQRVGSNLISFPSLVHCTNEGARTAGVLGVRGRREDKADREARYVPS
jgi:hypothetical protein